MPNAQSSWESPQDTVSRVSRSKPLSQNLGQAHRAVHSLTHSIGCSAFSCSPTQQC